MSKFIERDIIRLHRAANSLGLENIETNVQGPINRWHFHLKATFKGKTILMAFDPRNRPSGGARPERIQSFLDKEEWALSNGYLFYIPSRHHTTKNEARYELMKWIMQHKEL